jgi:hypothetical protein
VNTLVTAIAVDPLSPVNVYVGTTGGGIFRSTDAGRSWTPASTGLTNAVVTELALDPRTPNVLYAGTTGGGVFRSADAARNWTAFDTGLNNTSVAALAVTSGGACVHAGTVGRGAFDFAFTPGGCAPLPVQAAVLPSSRSVQVGAPATAFATIINTAPLALAGCRIAPLAAVPASFLYQTTDPATNQLIGTPNTPASIAAGGLQTFLISFTPTASIAPTDVRFDFSCLGAASAPLIAGVNTLLLSAAPGPVPDIVALVAADGGVVALSGPAGSGSFAVAGIDVGAAATISVTADTGSAFVPVSLLLCETDPSTGACQGGPADSVSHAFGAGGTATFGVFVTAFGPVANDPAVNRVFVRFTDADGATRGSTSVAVRTQ